MIIKANFNVKQILFIRS